MAALALAAFLALIGLGGAVEAAAPDYSALYKNIRKELQFPFGKYNIVWYSPLHGEHIENIAQVYPGWKVAFECANAAGWRPENVKTQVCTARDWDCKTPTTLQALFPDVPPSHVWWTGGNGKDEVAVLNVPATIAKSNSFSILCHHQYDKPDFGSRTGLQSYTITILNEKAPEGVNFQVQKET